LADDRPRPRAGAGERGARRPAHGRFRRKEGSGMSHMRRELGMLVALVLMCAGLWFSNPDFLNQSNVVNTTRQIAMLGIFGIGMAFVIITGGIDLSVGSIIGLTGVLICKLSSHAENC